MFEDPSVPFNTRRSMSPSRPQSVLWASHNAASQTQGFLWGACEDREEGSEASGRSRCGKACDAPDWMTEWELFIEGCRTQSLWSPMFIFKIIVSLRILKDQKPSINIQQTTFSGLFGPSVPESGWRRASMGTGPGSPEKGLLRIMSELSLSCRVKFSFVLLNCLPWHLSCPFHGLGSLPKVTSISLLP